MSRLITTINEGERKTATLNLSVDTTGQSIQLWAFNVLDADDNGVLLGTSPGAAADSPIAFSSLATHQLPAPGAYFLEGWINPDSDSRQCVYPEEEDTHELIVTDRRKVEI